MASAFFLDGYLYAAGYHFTVGCIVAGENIGSLAKVVGIDMTLAVNAMQTAMAILRAITEIHLIYLAIVICFVS